VRPLHLNMTATATLILVLVVLVGMVLHRTAAADELCAMDSIGTASGPCDWSHACFNGRGNQATGHPCDGSATGPCSRDNNNPAGYTVTDQTPYFTIPVVFHLINTTAPEA